MVNIKNKSLTSIPVFFEEVQETGIGDNRNIKVKVFLMHTGLNYNKSDFDKEVIFDALPTLAYIPIVGFIEQDRITGEEDFSDHRYVIVKDNNGVRRKYKGSAYGVILSDKDNNAHFEMRTCDDGVEREFLVVDGIIWRMFEDSTAILERDLVKNHSMELDENSIDGYEDEDGVFHFTKFSFRAACILGDGYEPAMCNSTVEVQFSINDFVKEFQCEFERQYTDFLKNIKNKQEGGNSVMPEGNLSVNKDYAMSVMQQFDNIAAIVSGHEMTVDRWGCSCSRYSLYDIQDNEVIVIDRKNNYQFYGFKFTMNGDVPDIDFTNSVRKKITFENYDEGTAVPAGAFNFANEIKGIEDKAFAKIQEANSAVETANEAVTEATAAKESAETNYTQIKADYDEIKPKYDAYVKEAEDRAAKEIDSAKDAEFAKFESALTGNDEFEALKEKKADLSVEDITSQCSVIFARLSLEGKLNFSKNNIAGSGVLGLTDDSDDSVPAGSVATVYGIIPVGK